MIAYTPEGFYSELKKKVKELQNEIEFQSFVEWNFKSTKQDVENLKSQIKKNQKSFYSYAALLWENLTQQKFSFHFPDMHSPNKIKDNQEVYSLPESLCFLYTLSDSHDEDYLNAYFDYLEQMEDIQQFRNALLPIFLSPLAINYFYNSFCSIMTPYFMGQKNLSLGLEEINNLHGSLLTSLQQNLCYCPSYLIKLLTKGDDFYQEHYKNSAKIVFRNYVLDILILFPNLFGIKSILKDDQKKGLLDTLSDSLNNLAELYIFILQSNNIGFELLSTEDGEAFGVSTAVKKDDFQGYFRQLLKISPKLPDKLPKKLKDKQSNEIVQALVVRPGPQYFKRYKLFEKIELSTQDKSSSSIRMNNCYMRAFHGMKVEHDSETLAQFSNDCIHLSHMQHITNKVISDYRQMALQTLKSNKLVRSEPNIYINKPPLLISDISKSKSNLIDKRDKLIDIFSDDNIYKSLIKGINFDTFVHFRKDILTADRSLNAILQCFKYHKFNISALQDFQKQNQRGFNELRNDFTIAFGESTDPLTKAKKISNVYSEIVRKVKSQVGVDVENLSEQERNAFIFSVFCLMSPAKIISVYVFLKEFIFNSSYNKIFEKAPYKNEINEINLSKNVLSSLISYCSNLDNLEGMNGPCPNFIYQCVNLSHICHENVNLNVNYDEHEKLAVMSDPDYSVGNKKYDEVKEAPGTKSLIDYFKQTDKSKNITLRIFVNDDKMYICNISYSKSGEGKPFPTDRLDLINYISNLTKVNK